MMNREASEPESAPSGRVSVVIPLWRDGFGVLPLIREISVWPEVEEVIVSATGDDEAARRLGETAGAQWITSREANRGRQLNLGARAAAGKWLLFHHSDSELSRAHVRSLTALNLRREVVGGAFYRRFDSRHPRCRWLEPIERWHNRSFGALYGDQSLFVRRDHFLALGGFADIPLMEDVEFSRRLRRSGPIALLDPPIASSPRKHLAEGAWKTTARNASLLLLFQLGVSPARLHRWYYGQRSSTHVPRPTLIPSHED